MYYFFLALAASLYLGFFIKDYRLSKTMNEGMGLVFIDVGTYLAFTGLLYLLIQKQSPPIRLEAMSLSALISSMVYAIRVYRKNKIMRNL